MTDRNRATALATLATLTSHIKEALAALAAAQRWLDDNRTDVALRESPELQAQVNAMKEAGEQLAKDFQSVNGAFAVVKDAELNLRWGSPQ